MTYQYIHYVIIYIVLTIKYIKFNFNQKIITLNPRQISIRGKREQLEVESAP